MPANACPQPSPVRGDATFTNFVGAPGSATGSTTTQVLDITPPKITVSVTPSRLAPPNHKLVPITATIVATDECDPNPQVRLVSITSSEPDNGLGDGDTPGDISGATTGTDDRAFQLRAERAGTGPGRTYTITYEAKDASGNTAQATATVLVPHDKKG